MVTRSESLRCSSVIRSAGHQKGGMIREIVYGALDEPALPVLLQAATLPDLPIKTARILTTLISKFLEAIGKLVHLRRSATIRRGLKAEAVKRKSVANAVSCSTLVQALP